MADIKIRLIYNLETGKKDIFIDYESEDDALPIEHEQDHREIVRQLLGSDALDPDEVGQINVGRVPGGAANQAPLAEAPPAGQPQAEGS